MNERSFLIKVGGAAVEQGQIPFMLLSQILRGVQETIYILASAAVEYDFRQRARIPKELQQACELRRVFERQGSYELVAAVAAPQAAGGIADIGLLCKERFLDILDCLTTAAHPQEMQACLRDILPDSTYMRRVVRSISSYCPKQGEPWNIGIGRSFESPLFPLTDGLRTAIQQNLSVAMTEDRVLIGELVHIHTDENRMGIFYAPAQRVITGTYEEELEDFVINKLREKIQVVGQVQLDGRGIPDKIINITEINEVDLQSLELQEIDDGEVRIVFKAPLVLQPELDEDAREISISCPELNIIASGISREEAVNEFENDFIWLWKEYVLTEMDALSSDARKMVERLRTMAKQVERK